MGKTLGKTFLGLELGWEGIMVSDEKTRRVARMTGLETENARACPFLTTCERRVKPEKKKQSSASRRVILRAILRASRRERSVARTSPSSSMACNTHATVPSPPHTRTRRSGTTPTWRRSDAFGPSAVRSTISTASMSSRFASNSMSAAPLRPPLLPFTKHSSGFPRDDGVAGVSVLPAAHVSSHSTRSSSEDPGRAGAYARATCRGRGRDEGNDADVHPPPPAAVFAGRRRAARHRLGRVVSRGDGAAAAAANDHLASAGIARTTRACRNDDDAEKCVERGRKTRFYRS